MLRANATHQRDWQFCANQQQYIGCNPINFHSSMCAHVGIFPLRRLVSRPYHYGDKVKHVWLNDSDTILHINESDQVTDKQSNTVSDGDKAMLAVEETETDTRCRHTWRMPMRMSTQVGRATTWSWLPKNNGTENAQITQEQK